MPLCGGLSGTKSGQDMETHIVGMISTLSPALLQLLDLDSGTELELHSYRSQVVAGVNYFTKLRVGDVFAHARIYRPAGPNAEPEIISVKKYMSESDEIESF